MQVMNSRIEQQDPEMKLYNKALELGLPVSLHTFHDGPDSYERIVIESAATLHYSSHIGGPYWQWSDVADLDQLLTQIQQLDPDFKDPFRPAVKEI